MKNQIVDRALGTGVFTGDLRYGRRNGDVAVKNGDFAGSDNIPTIEKNIEKIAGKMEGIICHEFFITSSNQMYSLFLINK